MEKSLLLVLFVVFGATAEANQPNPKLTPGQICTPSDPQFAGYRYAAHVAYCKRNVSHAEKQQVAAAYGVPESDWKNYEFDHLIPLNAGGSNQIANIWPEPLAEAREKDVVEQEVFDGLSRGTMTQAQAIQIIWDWLNQHQ